MANPALKKTKLYGFTFTPAPKRGEGGPIVTIEATTEWNDEVRGLFGFEEVPDSVTGTVKLLPASQPITQFKMRPTRGLAHYAIEMDAMELDEFKLFIPTVEDQPRELRFIIRTMSKNAETVMGKYGRTAGAAEGTLRYTINADEQLTLDGEEDDEQEPLPLKGDALEQRVAEIARAKRAKEN